ncbi:bifunctional adenosine 5'-phosphosulfate phosphorylase/adenylylsulfatase HINT4 isoform X3 [Dioscorea cayenensis subsp. rotundata]|uniref:Bifunctional adenosine 5'-phosphosulfate phosphorylase/adenylylsulfatase HINT4 isoform X3 n=1 Tax=Dioscorea cayennensis subsp. rotundata TaxID=55577 RepID=A0AB40B3N3_DIOCR|nr:bifunctional adenosine 5'-phosphosulfate phosphorylase/adenylylsulfatase HINT4 isoform X3 [Dioscorea cayenensis subsp. rotundata]
MAGSCLFCQIARSATSTRLLYADERVVAFPDINPSAFRHYLVIPVEHVATVNDLKRGVDDHQFGFHQPPFNSVDHLHLHCFALPYIPSFNRWKHMKYISLGSIGFIEAEKLLERIKPLEPIGS